MSKLFRLKQWLTVADAARHLASVLNEEVTEADVLRLGLDHQLVLSVYFVNHAKACRGTVVPMDKAKYREFSPELAATITLPREHSGKPVMVLEGINIDDKRVLELEPKIVNLVGVYDLPMIGSEMLDVEHRWQQLTDGPEVTLGCIEGAFVQEDELTLYQLQATFDDNEYQRGSRAALDYLKVKIADEKLPRKKADSLIKQHAVDRKLFLNKMKARPKKSWYYPAGGLPHDAMFVVRTKALKELQQCIESVGSEDKKKFGSREFKASKDGTVPSLNSAESQLQSPLASRQARRNAEIRSKYEELARAGNRNYIKEIQRAVVGAALLSGRRIRDIVKGR